MTSKRQKSFNNIHTRDQGYKTYFAYSSQIFVLN